MIMVLIALPVQASPEAQSIDTPTGQAPGASPTFSCIGIDCGTPVPICTKPPEASPTWRFTPMTNMTQTPTPPSYGDKEVYLYKLPYSYQGFKLESSGGLLHVTTNMDGITCPNQDDKISYVFTVSWGANGCTSEANLSDVQGVYWLGGAPWNYDDHPEWEQGARLSYVENRFLGTTDTWGGLPAWDYGATLVPGVHLNRGHFQGSGALRVEELSGAVAEGRLNNVYVMCWGSTKGEGVIPLNSFALTPTVTPPAAPNCPNIIPTTTPGPTQTPHVFLYPNPAPWSLAIKPTVSGEYYGQQLQIPAALPQATLIGEWWLGWKTSSGGNASNWCYGSYYEGQAHASLPRWNTGWQGLNINNKRSVAQVSTLVPAPVKTAVGTMIPDTVSQKAQSTIDASRFAVGHAYSSSGSIPYECYAQIQGIYYGGEPTVTPTPTITFTPTVTGTIESTLTPFPTGTPSCREGDDNGTTIDPPVPGERNCYVIIPDFSFGIPEFTIPLTSITFPGFALAVSLVQICVTWVTFRVMLFHFDWTNVLAAIVGIIGIGEIISTFRRG